MVLGNAENPSRAFWQRFPNRYGLAESVLEVVGGRDDA